MLCYFPSSAQDDPFLCCISPFAKQGAWLCLTEPIPLSVPALLKEGAPLGSQGLQLTVNHVFRGLSRDGLFPTRKQIKIGELRSDL